MDFCTYITWALCIWLFFLTTYSLLNFLSLRLLGYCSTWFSFYFSDPSFIISFLGSSSYLASSKLLFPQSSVSVLSSCEWFYQYSCPWLISILEQSIPYHIPTYSYLLSISFAWPTSIRGRFACCCFPPAPRSYHKPHHQSIVLVFH